MGYTVEPVAHQRPRDHRAGLAHQDQEGRLEGILGVGLVAEHAAADAQYHRPVPPHQGFEGRLVTLTDVALEQLGIEQARAVGQQGNSAQAVDSTFQESRRSHGHLVRATLYFREGAGFIQDFFR